MEKKPLVSVVMSVFDGAQFLDQSVRSIREQTYRNIEFIIIDDGSRDTTGQILWRHAQEDVRIRVITQQNRGLVESLQRGFAEATGEFIARMDADDVSGPERLDRQVRCLASNLGIAVVGTAVQIIDVNSVGVDIILPPVDPSTVREHLLRRGCVVFHPSVLVRRRAFEEIGGFRRAFRHAEDYDLWLRILDRFDIVNLDEVLLGYRRHEKSVSYTYARQQALSALCARHFAHVRLAGGVDTAATVELVTEEFLRSLGISQTLIDDAVFSHILSVTEAVVRSGVSSAAAEFTRKARLYASPTRLSTAALKLNRQAMKVKSGAAERRRHRLQLLGSDPDVYWELFGGPFNIGKEDEDASVR